VAEVTSLPRPHQATAGRPSGEFPNRPVHPARALSAAILGGGVRSAVLRRPSMLCPTSTGRGDAGTKWAVGALHAPHTTYD